MNDADKKTVDPFALWPTHASAVKGLGGSATPLRTSYAFHTDYSETRSGPVSFEGHFSALKATQGVLRLRVYGLQAGKSGAGIVTEKDIPLPALVANDGRWTVTFEGGTRTAHAIYGTILDTTDVSADDLVITLEGSVDSDFYTAALLDAREKIFASPSVVGSRWWRRGSPVDRAGLVSDEEASLAEPSSQMCTAKQMTEPTYTRWLERMRQGFVWHRKQWEFVYILSVLDSRGMFRSGTRGLGFGCGSEFLPAMFASYGCEIVATDMPQEMQESKDWIGTNQHSNSLDELQRPDLCDPDIFRRQVKFREVDMTAIPADLTGFDFCWSACAYEHLGSIDSGLEFVKNSVKCLRPGGIAVHTSELNLLSNDATVDNAGTVLFRRRDMEKLALELTLEGHKVLPLKYDQGDQQIDQYVDMPPYSNDEHLKLALQQFVSTSFGIAVIRGDD